MSSPLQAPAAASAVSSDRGGSLLSSAFIFYIFVFKAFSSKSELSGSFAVLQCLGLRLATPLPALRRSPQTSVFGVLHRLGLWCRKFYSVARLEVSDVGGFFVVSLFDDGRSAPPLCCAVCQSRLRVGFDLALRVVPSVSPVFSISFSFITFVCVVLSFGLETSKPSSTFLLGKLC